MISLIDVIEDIKELHEHTYGKAPTELHLSNEYVRELYASNCIRYGFDPYSDATCSASYSDLIITIKPYPFIGVR